MTDNQTTTSVTPQVLLGNHLKALKLPTLGRKNYLFAGSDAGGNRATAIYSLIETCKLNDIDPEAYFRDIFGRIADHKINRIAELLPWNWKTNQAA